MTDQDATAGKRPTRKSVPAPSVKRARKKGPSDSNDVESEIDLSSWSPEFRQLDQDFRSLNTVYTFCCTRKHLPTTFENLKSSVENLTGR
jgi:DEAD/DEAH box helicase domain-containing protein